MTYETLKRFFRSRIKRLLPLSRAQQDQQETGLVWGLSRDQLSQIQALVETTHYKHYLAAVEHLYEANLGAILRPLPHDAYLFQCGVCFALEQIAALPGDLTLKARELDARHTTSTTDTTSDADASAVFANTPFWDAYQRLGKRARQYGGPRVQVSGQRSDAPMGTGENGE